MPAKGRLGGMAMQQAVNERRMAPSRGIVALGIMDPWLARWHEALTTGGQTGRVISAQLPTGG